MKKFKLISMFLLCLFISIAAKKTVISAESTVKNLLVNGITKQGTTGWIDSKNVWKSANCTMNGRTGYFFWPNAVSSATLYQDVSVADYSAGTPMVLNATLSSYPQSPADISTLKLEFLDSEKTTVLDTKDVSYSGSTWKEFSIALPVPEGAKYARIILQGTRRSGSNLDSYFTDISFGAKDSGLIFDLTPKTQEIELKDQATASLTIDNVTDIAAEDVYITYDTEKLKYLGAEETDGIRLVYQNEATGTLRFMLASKGEANIITKKQILLNLKFQGIATGTALVDVTKGRITDGIEMEETVDDALCGDCTINIVEPKVPEDVNHSGEFTLIDLGIDARQEGKDPASEELSKYNTDISVNGAIDDDDLLKIGQLILDNPNYPFNN